MKITTNVFTTSTSSGSGVDGYGSGANAGGSFVGGPSGYGLVVAGGTTENPVASALRIVPQTGTAPSSAQEGDIWVDGYNHRFEIYLDGSWQTISTNTQLPIGTIILASLSSGDIADTNKFSSNGLGRGIWNGFAICNGNNGTANLHQKFSRLSTSGSGGTGGSDTNSHTHGTPSGTSGNESAHTHGVTSNVTIGNESAHTHGVTSNVTIGSEASHTHGSGSLLANLNHNGGKIYGEEVGGANYTANLEITIAGATSTVSQTTGIVVAGTSGAGSSHTHTPTNNAVTSGAGSSHTHAPTNNAVTSAAGSSHNHSVPAGTTTSISDTENRPAYYELVPLMVISNVIVGDTNGSVGGVTGQIGYFTAPNIVGGNINLTWNQNSLNIVGGSSYADGIKGTGGSISGNGIDGYGVGQGYGIYGVGGAISGVGIKGVGGSGGTGVQGYGTGNGGGGYFIAGNTSSYSLYGQNNSGTSYGYLSYTSDLTNYIGVLGQGSGTGAGGWFLGGTGGNAIKADGTVILQNQSSTPSDVSGYGQLYTKTDGYAYFKMGAAPNLEYNIIQTRKVFVGAIIFAALSAPQIAANFDGTGLGFNQYVGWAICNGNNGTPNLNAKFPRFNTSAYGGTGGEDSNSHTHTVSSLTLNSEAAHTHSVTSNVTIGSEASHTHGVTSNVTIGSEASHTHSTPNHRHLVPIGTNGTNTEWYTDSSYLPAYGYSATGSTYGVQPTSGSTFHTGTTFVTYQAYTDSSGASTTGSGSSHSHTPTNNAVTSGAGSSHTHAPTNNAVTSGAGSSHTHSLSSGSTGGPSDTENRPAYYELVPLMAV